jgi:hypothetical protein
MLAWDLFEGLIATGGDLGIWGKLAQVGCGILVGDPVREAIDLGLGIAAVARVGEADNGDTAGALVPI